MINSDLHKLDYYPFGMMMEGRSFSASEYRFGFNGQEKVNEVGGMGNHNTAMFWEYDNRIGRRWNLDPVLVPSVSQYMVFAGSPILYSDILGDVVEIEGEAQIGPQTEFVSNTRRTLDAIKNTDNGKTVVDELENSPNLFKIAPIEGGTGTKSLSFEKNQNGGGTINAGDILKMDAKQSSEALAEELFHGFQFENKQDPFTIDSEVGATIFGKSITASSGWASNMHGKNVDASINYESAINNLLFSQRFNLAQFRQAVNNFKMGSSENLPTLKYPNGPYNDFPVVNLELPLISKFYPLLK